MFSAISIDKTDAGHQAALRELDESELPDGDVTVRVSSVFAWPSTPCAFTQR